MEGQCFGCQIATCISITSMCMPNFITHCIGHDAVGRHEDAFGQHFGRPCQCITALQTRKRFKRAGIINLRSAVSLMLDCCSISIHPSPAGHHREASDSSAFFTPAASLAIAGLESVPGLQPAQLRVRVEGWQLSPCRFFKLFVVVPTSLAVMGLDSTPGLQPAQMRVIFCGISNSQMSLNAMSCRPPRSQSLTWTPRRACSQPRCG